MDRNGQKHTESVRKRQKKIHKQTETDKIWMEIDRNRQKWTEIYGRHKQRETNNNQKKTDRN